MTIRKLEVLAMTQDLEMALQTLKEEIEEVMQDKEEQKVDQERLLELETITLDQRTQIQVMEAVKQGFQGKIHELEEELEENQRLKEVIRDQISIIQEQTAENQRIKEANKAVQDQNKALREENLRLEKHCRRQLAGIQVVRAREDSQEERLAIAEKALEAALNLIKEQREMLEALLGLGTAEIPQY